MDTKATSLDDFVPDEEFARDDVGAILGLGGDLIEGVVVTPFTSHEDGRGYLIELLTERDGPIEPIVHVYQVYAAPGSVRAWVYHKHQHDRLAYTQGKFRLVLFDLRPESPTYRQLNVLEVGEAFRCRVTIPPYVVHGLQNYGDTEASFVNLPTRVWDPADPDKSRLPIDHPGIPYRFE